MKNYKELKEEYIQSLKSERFGGWLFAIIIPVVLIFLWIFGNPELWSIRQKLITTITGLIFSYFLGIHKIRECNKKIKEENL